MSTLSVRLPDDMAQRLKSIAKNRDISLNKLMFELSTQALAEEEARQRFVAAQLRGNRQRGLQMLDELDALEPQKASTQLAELGGTESETTPSNRRRAD